MGIYRTPLTLDEIIAGHVASMRSYAETIESWRPFISRKAVVARVRKCAGEVERAHAMFGLNEARKGQSPNGGDVKQAPALLTGPVGEADAPKGDHNA